MPVAELCRKHAFSEASYYLRRAINDAGTSLPSRGKLVIIGDVGAFTDVVNTVQNRGLVVEVIAPSP